MSIAKVIIEYAGALMEFDLDVEWNETVESITDDIHKYVQVTVIMPEEESL